MTTMGKRDDDEVLRRLERLEAEIEETRAAVGRDVESLGQRLTPEHVKEEAKAAVSSARDAGVRKVREVGHRATERARDLGSGGWQFVQDNALPLGLIGLGVGFLVRNQRETKRWESSTDEERPGRRFEELRDRASERAEELRDRASERAEEFRDRASERAEYALSRTRQSAADNPLAMGAAAVLAGIGIGLLLPETEQEEEWFGGARDQLAGGAREMLGEAKRAVSDTTREIQQTVRETAHH
jgi:ElaB/YqjD/DUF883 family membrane-anchored ribosome-binding protein